MKGRYQFDNSFVAEFSTNYNISIGVDGVLPLTQTPNIDQGKYFFLVLEPLDNLKRYVLRCYMDGGVVKYHGYDVTDNKPYLQNDNVQISDVSEYLNYLSDNTEDIGFAVNLLSNGVNVYGGEIIIDRVNVVFSDTLFPLGDFAEGVNYIILDYDTEDFIIVGDPAGVNGMRLATVVVNTGNVVSITDDRRLQAPINYNTDEFDFNNNELSLKDGGIDATKLDLSTISTDDIQEGATNLYYTESRVSANSDVSANAAARHTHANKALLDTYTQTELNLSDAVFKKHAHANKALLDTYNQTNADITTAVSDSHTHANKATLDAIPNYLSAGLSTVLTRTGAGLAWQTTSGTGGGGTVVTGGGSTPVQEEFTGDGITDYIDLAALPASIYSIFVFNDSGQFYVRDVDYVINTQKITFTTTPLSGRKISIIYFTGGSGGFANAAQDVLVGTGSQTLFSLSNTPVSTASIFAFNDSGQFYVQNVDYTIAGSDVTFSIAPGVGRKIYVIYFLPESVSTSGEVNTMSNIAGLGVGVFYQKVGVNFEMRKVRGINGITVSEDPTTHEIIVDGSVTGPSPTGEANVGRNVGTGAELYKGKSGVELLFRTVDEGDDIVKIDQTDDGIAFSIDEDALSPRLYRHFIFSGN